MASKQGTDQVFAQLQSLKDGASYVELAKLTGYSISALKQIMADLSHRGAVSRSITRPVVFKAIENPPSFGQTLIIREPAPLIELDLKKMAVISDYLDSDKSHPDELINSLFNRIKESTPEKNQIMMEFLVNLTEVIRQRLESTKELVNDDIQVNSKNGKR
jgi:hypothetical protein